MKSKLEGIIKEATFINFWGDADCPLGFEEEDEIVLPTHGQISLDQTFDSFAWLSYEKEKFFVTMTEEKSEGLSIKVEIPEEKVEMALSVKGFFLSKQDSLDVFKQHSL